jgi:cytoskeletal protein CcmA (bactofilin family)
MFSKSSQAAAAPEKAKKPATGNASGLSLLSSDAKITGNVESGGEVQIEGLVEGAVRAQSVLVSQAGTIKGEIVAETVRINGMVEGRISAKAVSLGQTARVVADIHHELLDIEKGAFFDGKCRHLTRDGETGARAEDQAARAKKDEPRERPMALVVGEPPAAATATASSAKP